MHGNSEMQKINQTSAMPEKLTFTGVVGLALHQCSIGCTVFEKQLVIHFVGAYWEPEVLLFLFISIHKAPFAALSD